MKEFLILVDENDQPLGKEEKLKVHQLGLLHRAFSVFIFNNKGQMLLQQRADEKYHSPGLWTNTCCSHPNYGEQTQDAIKRRLPQEMGMHCEANFAFTFKYKVNFSNGLTEHEYDHVYIGISDTLPNPEKSEVKDWRYATIADLENDILLNPDLYTEWMKIFLPEVKKHLNKFNIK